MTVANTNNKIQSTVDGIQTDFPYDFLVQEAEDMTVFFDDTVEVTGYTVTGLGNPLGGLVIFDTAPPDTISTLSLMREIEIKQKTDYTVYGAFPPERVEADFDKSILIDQQFDEKLNRALLAPVSADGSFDYSMPTPIAGHVYKVSDTGDALVMSDYPLDDAVNQSEAAKDAAEVAEANSQVSSTNSANCATESYNSMVSAQLKVWEAEAERLTADSYAVEPEDVFVKSYTSDGDGTFTATNTTDYSALHWAAKASNPGSLTFTGLIDTPADYTGQTGKIASVNATEDGLEFTTPSGGDVEEAPEDGKQYGRQNAGWTEVAAGGGDVPTGGGTDKVFYENGMNVTTDYTLTASNNAMSAGPITVDAGATVTVPTGAVWTVV